MPLLTTITTKQLTGVGVTFSQPSPEAAYISLTLDAATYNEGDTVTATVSTANVDDAVTVNYTVTGISSSDISSGSLTGTFTISNNTATATWVLREDGLTEGTDTFVITLAATDSTGTSTGSPSDSASIADTSNDPNATLWLDDNDDPVSVRSIIGGFSMQMNGVFAVNPAVPFSIGGRTSGATTTVTNITANTGTFIEVDDSGNSTNFIVGEQLNLLAITYSITPAASSVNEGSSLTFTINTQNLPNGYTLYWTVSRPEDFDVSSGSFTINSNSAQVQITPAADATTEGAETFTVSVRTGSISGPIVATSTSVTIIDTSFEENPTQIYDYATGAALTFTDITPSTDQTLYSASSMYVTDNTTTPEITLNTSADGTYTYEFWVYPVDWNGTFGPIVELKGSTQYVNIDGAGALRAATSTQSFQGGTTPVPGLNAWRHFVIVVDPTGFVAYGHSGIRRNRFDLTTRPFTQAFETVRFKSTSFNSVPTAYYDNIRISAGDIYNLNNSNSYSIPTGARMDGGFANISFP